ASVAAGWLKTAQYAPGMSPRLTASSHSPRSAASSFALANCLIAASWRRSSAFWISFPPPCGRPASVTPCFCRSRSSAVSALWTPSFIISRRSSALERQVPMIEQCTLPCMSQIDVRRLADGVTKSPGGTSSPLRAFIGIKPRGNPAGGRPVEKMLDNISGARDDMAHAISITIQRLSHTFAAMERGFGLGFARRCQPGSRRLRRLAGGARAEREQRLADLAQHGWWQAEHQRGGADFEHQKWLVIVGLSDIDGTQRQRYRVVRRPLEGGRRLQPFGFAGERKQDADQVLHIADAQAQIHRSLRAALDAQPDGFALGRHFAEHVGHEWRIARGLG